MESKEGSDFADLDDDMPNEMMMAQKFKNRKTEFSPKAQRKSFLKQDTDENKAR